MDRAAAVRVLERLHDAQNQFYGGGDATPLAELLAADVYWSVPGQNRIAGTTTARTRSLATSVAAASLPAPAFRCTARTSWSARATGSPRSRTARPPSPGASDTGPP